MYAPKDQRGATLMDTIVGIALMVVVFTGITAVFQLSVEVVSNNKARTGALALAQDRMEFIRSLDYFDVGTVGGVPDGALAQSENLNLNGVDYTRRTLILYADDPKDGEGVLDGNGITADYRVAKVEVSWTPQSGDSRSVALTSRISPPGIEQLVEGGTLAFTVVDSSSNPVSSALVNIFNASVTPSVDTSILTNASGTASLIGAPEGAGYEITVTKTGYNSDQTYDADASNPNPDPGHLTVVNYTTTPGTFAIDLVGSQTIQTYLQIFADSWTDEFDDSSKIASSTNITLTSGQAHLTTVGTYLSPGFLESIFVAPTYLNEWTEFSWSDTRPVSTNIIYQVYYSGGLVPDVDLPGNSAGFTTSPVDLSALSTTTYTSLKAYATLSTSDNLVSPAVLSWDISFMNGPTPLANLDFSMRGDKTIGTDGGSNPIYKYEQTLNSGGSASVNPTGLEWDSYTMTVDGAATGYDIAESCEPQAVDLPAGGWVLTRLFMVTDTPHTLLVDVRDSGTNALIKDANVRITRGVVDQTVTTGACGQSFFENMAEGTISGGDAYSIEVTAGGYTTFMSTDDVEISGASTLSVVLDTV